MSWRHNYLVAFVFQAKGEGNEDDKEGSEEEDDDDEEVWMRGKGGFCENTAEVLI